MTTQNHNHNHNQKVTVAATALLEQIKAICLIEHDPDEEGKTHDDDEERRLYGLRPRFIRVREAIRGFYAGHDDAPVELAYELALQGENGELRVFGDAVNECLSVRPLSERGDDGELAFVFAAPVVWLVDEARHPALGDLPPSFCQEAARRLRHSGAVDDRVRSLAVCPRLVSYDDMMTLPFSTLYAAGDHMVSRLTGRRALDLEGFPYDKPRPDDRPSSWQGLLLGAAVVPGWDAAGFMDPDLDIKPNKAQFLAEGLEEWSKWAEDCLLEETGVHFMVGMPNLLMEAVMQIAESLHQDEQDDDEGRGIYGLA